MSEHHSLPVTVSVIRHVDGGAVRRVPGFGLGATQHGLRRVDMLYGFADAGSLAAWEASPQRAWWLEAAQGGGIEATRVERRTGIEGWFDEPSAVETQSLGTPPAPPRWKQAVTIFLVFFPLSLLSNWVVAHTIIGWPLPLRVLVTIVVMTPLMTYLLLPWITRRMAWWLHR